MELMNLDKVWIIQSEFTPFMPDGTTAEKTNVRTMLEYDGRFKTLSLIEIVGDNTPQVIGKVAFEPTKTIRHPYPPFGTYMMQDLLIMPCVEEALEQSKSKGWKMFRRVQVSAVVDDESALHFIVLKRYIEKTVREEQAKEKEHLINIELVRKAFESKQSKQKDENADTLLLDVEGVVMDVTGVLTVEDIEAVKDKYK